MLLCSTLHKVLLAAGYPIISATAYNLYNYTEHPSMWSMHLVSFRLLTEATQWCDAGMVICLERAADLHMAQLMPLPLSVLLQ